MNQEEWEALIEAEDLATPISPLQRFGCVALCLWLGWLTVAGIWKTIELLPLP